MLQVARIEETGASKSWAQDRRTDVALERPAKPSAKRHGETLLRSIHDLPRQIIPHRLLEQPLAFVAANFERRWQGPHPFDQRVVHQRLPNLKRMRHACAVNLGVDIADKIGLDVEVLDERE